MSTRAQWEIFRKDKFILTTTVKCLKHSCPHMKNSSNKQRVKNNRQGTCIMCASYILRQSMCRRRGIGILIESGIFRGTRQNHCRHYIPIEPTPGAQAVISTIGRHLGAQRVSLLPPSLYQRFHYQQKSVESYILPNFVYEFRHGCDENLTERYVRHTYTPSYWAKSKLASRLLACPQGHWRHLQQLGRL